MLCAGAGELRPSLSGLASYDTIQYATSRTARGSALDGGAVAAEGTPPLLATAASGVLARPLAGHAVAAGNNGEESVSGSGLGQPSQGFMPYKWRHHPLPRGVHQLQPGGVLSLGKRSASASLAEPPRKRTVSGNLP